MYGNIITIYHLSIPEFYKDLKLHGLDGFLQDDALKNHQAINSLFVRAVLEVYSGQDVEIEDIIEQSNGKPILNPEKFIGIHFNKSHTEYDIVIALASFPLGIDLEAMKGSYNALVLDRIVHPEDQLKISSPKEFYQLWSIKEAFVKHTGEGFALPLDEVVITTINNDQFLAKSSNQNAEVRSIDVLQNHYCFVAGKRVFSSGIKIIDHAKNERMLIEELANRTKYHKMLVPIQ
ncbi:MAG: phosphopantetheinyl transferase [Flavobacteriaceae bacterium]|jgi:phosphopantetheinyl transferase